MRSLTDPERGLVAHLLAHRDRVHRRLAEARNLVTQLEQELSSVEHSVHLCREMIGGPDSRIDLDTWTVHPGEVQVRDAADRALALHAEEDGDAH
jgi:predicted naringenin-chalcone synthase